MCSHGAAALESFSILRGRVVALIRRYTWAISQWTPARRGGGGGGQRISAEKNCVCASVFAPRAGWIFRGNESEPGLLRVIVVYMWRNTGEAVRCVRILDARFSRDLW